MSIFISLLRGINVGGKHKIKMDELKLIYQSLGLNNVHSLLQSGNVIFHSNETDRTLLSTQLETAIEEKYGFRPRVILRSLTELQNTVKNTPFNDNRERDPSRLMVTFLLNHPGEQLKQSFQSNRFSPEEVYLINQEVFIYYPEGVLESKLDLKLLEKQLNTSGTTRNWNTVTKLLKLAENNN